jgi:hypothetical protein
MDADEQLDNPATVDSPAKASDHPGEQASPNGGMDGGDMADHMGDEDAAASAEEDGAKDEQPAAQQEAFDFSSDQSK